MGSRISEVDFIKEVGRLCESKGKYYSDEEFGISYRILNKISQSELEWAVNDLILDFSSLPPMRKLVNYCTPRIHRLNEQERELEFQKIKENKTKCKYCDNYGTVNAWEYKEGYSCAFRCQCPHGDRFLNIPKWDSILEGQFKLFIHDRQGSYEYGLAQGYHTRKGGRVKFSFDKFIEKTGIDIKGSDIEQKKEV